MVAQMRNRAECRQCHDVIESTYRHDWVACSCWTDENPNGGIFVDGGKSYWRAGGDMNNFIRLDDKPFLDPDTLAAIRVGIEDWKAGRVSPLSIVLKELGLEP